MRQQTLGTFICVLVAASVCGVGYSQWNDIIEIHTEMTFGTLTLRYVHPLDWWDIDDATKDTGKFLCEYTDPDLVSGGFETLAASISNAYPSYEAYCTFTIENVGSLPDHIGGIAMIPGAGLVIGETYVDAAGNPTGWRLDDAGSGEPRLTVHVSTDVDSSLVCKTIDPGGQMLGLLTVMMEDGVELCHTYSFEVEIVYD